MSIMKKVLKIFFAMVGSFLLLCGIGPIIYGNFHVGAIACAGFGGMLLCLVLLWDRFQTAENKAARWWAKLRGGVTILLCSGGAVAAVLSGLMVQAAFFTPPGQNHTVVILGCQVRGTEPSLMLRYRLNAALAYLNENPGANVVCSGGLGETATMSEAEVMQRYLVAHGIESSRIYLEDRSTSTEENLAFSAQIIHDNNLPDTVAIATDSFHEYRGGLYAKRAGLMPYAIPGKTPWGLFPSYWVREWFGILKMLFF